MRTGIKHLVECHCILPQFRDQPDPVYHRFVVFSIVDGNDNVIPKHVQCNNCGVVHKVLDIMKSEISMGNDNDAAIISVEDVKLSLPDNVVSVLDSYQVDLPTWEEAVFLLENKLWGSHVILTSDTEANPDVKSGKLLKLVSPVSIKIEPYLIKITAE